MWLLYYHPWITPYSLKCLKLSAFLQDSWKSSTPLSTNGVPRKAVKGSTTGYVVVIVTEILSNGRYCSPDIVMLIVYTTKWTSWLAYTCWSTYHYECHCLISRSARWNKCFVDIRIPYPLVITNSADLWTSISKAWCGTNAVTRNYECCVNSTGSSDRLSI